MFTLSIIKRTSSFYNSIEWWDRPIEKPSIIRREVADTEMERIMKWMGSAKDAQSRWIRQSKIDQFDADSVLSRELSLIMMWWIPKNSDRPATKDISLDSGKKLSGKFADAQFSNTQGSIDIYIQGDRTILSTPWKDPVDFSTEVFASRKDLILSQYAQNTGVPESARDQIAQAPRSPKLWPVSSPKVIPWSSGEWPWLVLQSIEPPRLSDKDILEAARQDKLAASTGLSLSSTPESRRFYEDMLQRAEGEIKRLEAKIAQAQKAEEYARLSPEQREVADTRTTLSDMRKNFGSLMDRDARWDRSVRTEMRRLFVDIKKLESNLASLERWQSEVTRLRWEIKTAQATIDARRGNDTFGTLTKQIESAKATITRTEAEMVAIRSASAPVLAQYQNRSKNEKLA